MTGDSTVTAAGPAAVRLRGIGLAIQAAGPARFAAAALDQQGVKGTGTIDVSPPTELGATYTLTSRFEYTDSDLASGTFGMIRGIWLSSVTGDSLMGSVFDTRQNEAEATVCFSGRAEEYLSLEQDTPISELPEEFRVKTANLEFSAKWSLSGNTITVHREFASTIDQPLCTGDLRKETVAALAQIRDHYDNSTFVSYTTKPSVSSRRRSQPPISGQSLVRSLTPIAELLTVEKAITLSMAGSQDSGTVTRPETRISLKL